MVYLNQLDLLNPQTDYYEKNIFPGLHFANAILPRL